jgi:plasmid replication initiation protein
MSGDPLRRPPADDRQMSLFVAPLFDIASRDHRDLMERTVVSLGKRPRREPINHEWSDGYFIRTRAENGELGIANMRDYDIIIWLSSQLREKLDRGEAGDGVIRFHPSDLLRAIRRGDGGQDYVFLRNAVQRLWNTTIQANLPNGIFGESRMIDERYAKQRGAQRIIREWDQIEWRDVEWVQITLGAFLVRQVKAGRVLTVNPNYFLLKLDTDRMLYRIARCCAGDNPNGWTFTVQELLNRSGSNATFKEFSRDVREAVARDALPDYSMKLITAASGQPAVQFRITTEARVQKRIRADRRLLKHDPEAWQRQQDERKARVAAQVRHAAVIDAELFGHRRDRKLKSDQ